MKRLKCPFSRWDTSGCLIAKQLGDFPLLELPLDQQLIDVEPKLRPREPLIGIVQPQIGKDVA